MQRVTFFNVFSLVLNFLFAGLLIMTFAMLVKERSKDVVRVTVTDAEVRRSALELQRITGKVAYAYPVGDSNEPLWRITIDDKSEPNGDHF